jgi:acetyl esterase/lipase
MGLRLRTTAIAVLLLLAPCAGASLFHREARLPAGTEVRRDLAYGSDPAQALDVYSLGSHAGRRPVIVMVHGGAWAFGDKEYRGVVQSKLAHWLPRGVIFVSVNYRMLPRQDVGGQAEDVARALAFVQQHAQEWGGDPEHLTLMGHSAGAHLAALLSADPERARAFGVRRWNATVALDSAALDVVAIMERPHHELYDRAFGADPAAWRGLSPLHQLGARAVPLLAVCSTQRPDRPCDQAEQYVAHAQALGVDGAVLPMDLDHGEVNKELGTQPDYTAAVDRFITSHAHAGGGPARAR